MQTCLQAWRHRSKQIIWEIFFLVELHVTYSCDCKESWNKVKVVSCSHSASPLENKVSVWWGGGGGAVCLLLLTLSVIGPPVFVYLSVSLSLSLSLSPSMSLCVSVSLSLCMFVSLSLCVSVCLSLSHSLSL